METSRVRTSRKALERFFQRNRKRVVMEAAKKEKKKVPKKKEKGA